MDTQLTNGQDDTKTTIGQTSTVYVIAIECRNPEEKFRYLLIYEDNTTAYVILRPMMQKSDCEIAMTLFQIFTQWGPARTVDLCGYNPHLAQNISKTLKHLCPMFTVEIRHKPMKFDTPAKVMEALDMWRSDNSDFWELGCAVVQWKLNNRKITDPFDKESLTTPQKLIRLANNESATKKAEETDTRHPNLCDMNGMEVEEEVEIFVDEDLDQDVILLNP